MGFLYRITGYDADFCVDTFLPELHQATANLELDQATEERLTKGFVGTVIKLLYGVLWQV